MTTYLTPHFTVEELECKCGCGFGRQPGDVSPRLLALLEGIRVEVGVPVVINSGCRCDQHNADEGGVPGSVHTLGEAADIKTIGGEKKYWIEKAAFKHGAMGVGIGKTFVHVDVHQGDVKYRPTAWGYGDAD